MSARYTLTVTTDFAAAHHLRDYPGECRRLHGHNWKVEAEVEATRLDELGMAVDFKEIKRGTREIAKGLDHRYLNELEPFQGVNPTAEHIAAYFFRELSQRLNSESIRVGAVTLWETDSARVRYSEEPGEPTA